MKTTNWNVWANNGCFIDGVQSEDILVSGVTDQTLKEFRFWLEYGAHTHSGRSASDVVAIQPFIFRGAPVDEPFILHLSSEYSSMWRAMHTDIIEWWETKGCRVGHGIDGEEPRVGVDSDLS